MAAEPSTGSQSANRCYAQKAEESGPSLFHNGDLTIQAHHVGWLIAGFFTITACIASFWLIDKHLQWYTNKREQRYIVRLLFMVPIYAVISFASFLFWTHATPIILVRDAYEATVLSAFFYLLLSYLSPTVKPDPHNKEADMKLSPEEKRQASKARKAAYINAQKVIFMQHGLSYEADRIAIAAGEPLKKWVLPLNFVKWKPEDGLYFLQLMKWGVLQYCVIKPLCALAAVALDYMGLYCESSWGLGWGHVYLTVIVSLSVTVAMYCLVQLYVCVSLQLAPQKPLLKLFAIKAVVFLTFWQATFLSGLSMLGVVKDTKYMTAEDINIGFGALLETFEMMIFAFLHIRAFTYKPYRPPMSGLDPEPNEAKKTPRLRSLGHAMNFRETFRELGNGWLYMIDRILGRPPRSDLDAKRVGHYEGAFGRPRPSNVVDTGMPYQEKTGNGYSYEYGMPEPGLPLGSRYHPQAWGEREWLGIGDRDANTDAHSYRIQAGNNRREKSDGLETQIERELERRGFGLQSDLPTRGGHIGVGPRDRHDEHEQTGYHHKPQRSWWRSVYNRVSQSGGDPLDYPEMVETQERRLSPPPLRRSRRNQQNSRNNAVPTSDSPPLLLQKQPVSRHRSSNSVKGRNRNGVKEPNNGDQNALLVDYDYFYDADDGYGDQDYEQDAPPPASVIRQSANYRAPRNAGRTDDLLAPLSGFEERRSSRQAEPSSVLPVNDYSEQFAILQRQRPGQPGTNLDFRYPTPMRSPDLSNNTHHSPPRRAPVSPPPGAYLPRQTSSRNAMTPNQPAIFASSPKLLASSPTSPPRERNYGEYSPPEIRRPTMRNSSSNFNVENASNIAQPSYSGTSAVTRHPFSQYPAPSNAVNQAYSSSAALPMGLQGSRPPAPPRSGSRPSRLVFPEPLSNGNPSVPTRSRPRPGTNNGQA